MIKEKFTKIIEKELPRLFDITKSLYENPEIGTLEYKSSKIENSERSKSSSS